MAHSTASVVLVAVLAGVAGGGASALALGNRDGAAPAIAAAPGAAPSEARPPARSRPETRRTPAALPREEAPEEAANDDAPEPTTADVPFEPEEILRVQQERLRQSLDAHAAEPVDAAWARETERALDDGARAVAEENAFEHVRTECRSTTCAVTYRWPSRQLAEQSFAATAHHDYPVNCARTMTLPDGEARPFEATLMLRCR